MARKAKLKKALKKGRKLENARPAKKPKPGYAKKGLEAEPERLKKWYEEQLAEKDRIIEKLNMENALLLATALKQGAKTREIYERARKAILKKK